jgi:hypothetical protein
MPKDSKETRNAIITYMAGADNQLEFTIPDIQKGTGIKNREKVVVALTELKAEGKLKDRGVKTKYYRLANAKHQVISPASLS